MATDSKTVRVYDQLVTKELVICYSIQLPHLYVYRLHLSFLVENLGVLIFHEMWKYIFHNVIAILL